MKQHWINYQRELASRYARIPYDVPNKSEWQLQLLAMLHAERMRTRPQQETAQLTLPGIERFR